MAPIRIATNIGDDDPVTPLPAAPATTEPAAEHLRIIRTLMAEAPPAAPSLRTAARAPSL
jgi:hypothetical protein